MMSLRFTEADADKATEAFGFNCGPAALCALLSLTIQEVRPHLGNFKGYMTPTMMRAALKNAGARVAQVPYGRAAQQCPAFGLVYVQWTGPWTKPGVPVRAAYRHTHWIAAVDHPIEKTVVYDINAGDVGWISIEDWSGKLAPQLIPPKGDGGWYYRLVLDVERAA